MRKSQQDGAVQERFVDFAVPPPVDADQRERQEVRDPEKREGTERQPALQSAGVRLPAG